MSSPIVIGEFRLIFFYAVMLIWREFLEFSSFWRGIKLYLERAGETNGEFVTHTILLGARERAHGPQSVFGAKNSTDFSKKLRN